MKKSYKIMLILAIFIAVLVPSHNVYATKEIRAVPGKTYSGNVNYIDWDCYRFTFKSKCKVKIEISGKIVGKPEYVMFSADNDISGDYHKTYIKEKKLRLNSSSYSTTLTVDPGKLCLILSPDSYRWDYDVDSCKYKLKVTELTNATSIKMETSKEIYKGEKRAISTKVLTPSNSGMSNAKWSTSNPKIATVTKQGYVTGIGVGKATITCQLSNRKRYRCVVTVKPTPAIFITEGTIDIDSAGGVKPHVKIKNNSNNVIKYVYLNAYFYNTVGDPARCSITGRYNFSLEAVGPINGKQSVSKNWSPVLYNRSTGKMKITTATVVLKNGKRSTVNINKTFGKY